MSHESSDFEDIDLGTEDRGAALLESAPTEAEGTPAAPTEQGDLLETNAEAAQHGFSEIQDEHNTNEMNSPDVPPALENGDEAEGTDTLEEDLWAALREDEQEGEAPTVREVPKLDTTVPGPTEDESSSATPLWDRVLKADWGPLNDEDADMNLEAAERRAAEEACRPSNDDDADMNPEAAARTAAEAARGYHYEDRPRTPYEGSSDEALVLYSPRIHWDWVINRRYKPTDAELRAVAVRANGATSPLRKIRNVEDGFSPEPSPELDKLPPLPVSPTSPASPAESWEAFQSNTGEEEDVEPETKSEEDLFEELFGSEDVVNAAAERDERADEDPVSDADPAPETAGRLHISTSDVELQEPKAIRPSVQTQANVDDLLSDDKENDDEPKTPPSAEVLATMTGMTPEQSFHPLEQTYEQFQRCGLPDPADTLQLKRKLFYHERDRLKYNGFTDRYLEQIQAGPTSSENEEPKKYENEVKAKEMFTTVAAHLYRQQREEYRRKNDELDERRMDDEYHIERLQREAKEDEYEISMLKHKVDEQRAEIVQKTRETEGWKQGFERNAQFAKDAYDRKHQAEEENDGEEDDEDGGTEKLETKDAATQVFLPVSESRSTQTPRLRGSQTESEVDYLKAEIAALQRSKEQLQEREMKLSADYRESQRKLRNADEVWQMIPPEVEDATKYVDELSRQRYIAEDENRKTKEENERLKKILNEYMRFEEERKKNEQEAKPVQAPQAVPEAPPTQPSDTLPAPSTFAPPAASSSSSTSPAPALAGDLSQYFMGINPAAPPPPSPFPQTQEWLALEAEIRQLNSYKQNRAAFLRQYKLQSERRLMDSERRWKRRVAEGLVFREDEMVLSEEVG